MTPHKLRVTMAMCKLYLDVYAAQIVPSWLPQPAKPRKRAVSEARRRGGLRAAEKRADAWHETEHEYASDPAALLLLARSKGRLLAFRKSHPRMSILECFQHYLHDHPSEYAGALAQMADHDYGPYPVPTDEELDLQSLESTLEGMVAA